MESRQSYRWQKIAISIALLISAALICIRMASFGPNIPGLFGFYSLGWLIIVPFTIAALVCRIFRVLKSDAFIYIFLGVANLGLSASGIYFGIGGSNSNWIWLGAYVICGLLALVILADPLFYLGHNSKQKES